MTLFPLTDCCAMLGIDPKTLRHWLKHANLPLAAHPTDARIKCLTLEHVQQLASLHARPLQSPVSASPVLGSFQEQASPKQESETAHVQATHVLPSSFLQAADLIQRLSCLETQVSTMQQQLAQLALELLQERTLRYEQRLHTLEALIHPPQRQEGLPPALQTMEGQFQQGERDRKEPGVHPAELRARSRVLPLIEYGARGTYVIICPQQGELPLTPDSPQWFDWLATLSSFRFIGKQGRFSAYRKGRMSRRWSAYRTIHQHDYQHYLGTTDHLTIDSLEQMAAKLQSYMSAL
jgi:hypothetical protein